MGEMLHILHASRMSVKKPAFFPQNNAKSHDD